MQPAPLRTVWRERAHLTEADPRRVAELQVHARANRHTAFAQSQRLDNNNLSQECGWGGKRYRCEKLSSPEGKVIFEDIKKDVEPAEQPYSVFSNLNLRFSPPKKLR